MNHRHTHYNRELRAQRQMFLEAHQLAIALCESRWKEAGGIAERMHNRAKRIERQKASRPPCPCD